MQEKGIQSVKVISEEDSLYDYQVMFFDSLGNNVESILVSPCATSYFLNTYIDTLLQKEIFFTSKRPNDTTIVAIYKYDKAERLKVEEEYYLNQENGLANRKIFEYNESGGLSQIFVYESGKEIVYNYEYDQLGRLEKIKIPKFSIISEVRYQYLRNTVIEINILRSDGSFYAIDKFVYDEQGNLIFEEEKISDVYRFYSSYEYQDGLLIKINTLSNYTVRFEYEFR